MEPQFAARCSPKGCLAADCGRTAACGRGFPASRISAMVRAPRTTRPRTLGDDRDLLLLHPVLALGLPRRPPAAGRRAAPPRPASAEALRLPGRGAADGRRADPDGAEAAARLSRRRARPLAPIPRHAAEPDAALLSDGEPGAGLEQARRPHGDRRAPGWPRPFPAVARAPAGALGGGARHRRPGVRRAVAEENGYDGAALLAAETAEPVQREYRDNGAEAERLGVFGSPTFVVEGELFWGQDRLDFVDRALDRLRWAKGGQAENREPKVR